MLKDVFNNPIFIIFSFYFIRAILSIIKSIENKRMIGKKDKIYNIEINKNPLWGYLFEVVFPISYLIYQFYQL